MIARPSGSVNEAKFSRTTLPQERQSPQQEDRNPLAERTRGRPREKNNANSFAENICRRLPNRRGQREGRAGRLILQITDKPMTNCSNSPGMLVCRSESRCQLRLRRSRRPIGSTSSRPPAGGMREVGARTAGGASARFTSKARLPHTGACLATVWRRFAHSAPFQLLQSVVPTGPKFLFLARVLGSSLAGREGNVLRNPDQRHEMPFLRICQ